MFSNLIDFKETPTFFIFNMFYKQNCIIRNYYMKVCATLVFLILHKNNTSNKEKIDSIK